ncbi:MAG: DUF1080 domain-containing protein [Salegentibacter mishustinae]|nr:DUF1080 domain-containing protein [Salegentibacter mishustinae]
MNLIKKYRPISISIMITAFFVVSCKEKSKNSASENSEVVEMDNQTQKSKVNSNELTPDEIDQGWRLLFDGESTEGWRGYNKNSFPEKGWEIEDNALKVIGSGTGEAGSGGDIIFDEEFKNFELSLEWKISEGGNSGIFYLAEEIEGEPIYTSAPEMQILDNKKHPDAKLGNNGNRMAGSLYDLIPAKPQNAKPVGQWNKVSILVYRGTVVHSQNGENVVEYHLWTDKWNEMVSNSKFKNWENFLNAGGEDKKGYIGLQDHGDDVWFRNIKIKEL